MNEKDDVTVNHDLRWDIEANRVFLEKVNANNRKQGYSLSTDNVLKKQSSLFGNELEEISKILTDKDCPNKILVDLSEAKILPEKLQYVITIITSGNCSSIDLSCTILDDTSFELLIPAIFSGKTPRGFKANFSNNEITDKGIKKLSQAFLKGEGCPQDSSFNLSETVIGNSGIEELFKSLRKDTSLKELIVLNPKELITKYNSYSTTFFKPNTITQLLKELFYFNRFLQVLEINGLTPAQEQLCNSYLTRNTKTVSTLFAFDESYKDIKFNYSSLTIW